MKTNFIKTVILLLFVNLATSAALAAPSSEEIPYYGEEFYRSLKAGESNKSLLALLKTVLKAYHNPQPGTYDRLSTSCDGKGCYQHIAVGYKAARVFMFGTFYLKKTDHGYSVKDVYCERDREDSEFRHSPPMPGQVPDNTVINCEHTWPQSRFTNRYPTEMQKSDIHHLFPTDSEMNAIRGNNPFGEVVKDETDLKCRESRFGTTASGRHGVFEPPKSQKGNTARAMFYFATRYDMVIDAEQEASLRKWDKEDPVDAEEQDRNEKIAKLQGSRNPFVDYPELVDRINNFQGKY